MTAKLMLVTLRWWQLYESQFDVGDKIIMLVTFSEEGQKR